MLSRSLHNRWLRLFIALLGCLICAVAINVFIVPLGLYTGGLMGLCQLIRTLLLSRLNFSLHGIELAGVLYFIFNIPLIVCTYRALGKTLIAKTLIGAIASSVFFALVPIPSAPVVDDMLTSCLLGGILNGVGGGLVLTCGFSCGGLDVIGLYLSKKSADFTVGKFSLGFNSVLYAICFFMFSPSVVIYSVIYNFFSALVLDRMHQQNITVQVLIFTKEHNPDLPRFIMTRLERGVTYWKGHGGYTGDELEVLCVCLSKYEIEELRGAVHELDPNAFFIIQEGVTVGGHFVRRLSE